MRNPRILLGSAMLAASTGSDARIAIFFEGPPILWRREGRGCQEGPDASEPGIRSDVSGLNHSAE